jgi:hypothetical protein
VAAVLGFDAREGWADPLRLWPAARRMQYLLRPDIVKPLSVDVMVWPSVFRDPGVEQLHLGDGLGNDGIIPPAFVGPCHGLWTDLDEMRGVCVFSARPLRVVAVVAQEHPLAGHSAALDGSAAAAWPTIGFDVADEYLLSGLTDCGYGDELVDAQRRFGGALNEHHLFANDADARAFAAFSDTRVTEHAPFYVYELRARPS